ncbi:MAG: Fe-S cluster assembly sulfur transfer protein SufU [Planctomycetota bacterium]|jgi:nitrogen fixation NifU-like protein
MMDLRELYQQVILDHNRTPRNWGRLESPCGRAEGLNPLCGDRYEVFIRTSAEGSIEDVKFEGEGCAISKASASLMTGAVIGQSRERADELFAAVHALLTDSGEGRGCGELEWDPGSTLAGLQALGGVRRFPMRVKCATLAWHALKAALASPEGQDPVVSTEVEEEAAR